MVEPIRCLFLSVAVFADGGVWCCSFDYHFGRVPTRSGEYQTA